MEIIKVFLEVFTGILKTIWDSVSQIVAAPLQNELDPSFFLIFLIFILVGVILANPFVSAEIAEMRGKNIKWHFINGLLMPFFYPVSIYITMRSTYGTKAAERAKKKMEEDEEHKIEEKSHGNIDENGNELNQDFFFKYAFDDDGIPEGSFLLTLNDGTQIEAVLITEAKKDMLQANILNKNDEQVNIRLPYKKIVSCEMIVEE